MVVELYRVVRGGETWVRARRMIVSRSVYLMLVYLVRHPRGGYIVFPLLSLEVATPESKSGHATLSSVCRKVRARCQDPPHKRFLVGCCSPFMRLAEHLTALRAWCRRCLLGR